MGTYENKGDAGAQSALLKVESGKDSDWLLQPIFSKLEGSFKLLDKKLLA